MTVDNETMNTAADFPRNWLQLFADEVPAGGGAPDLGGATTEAAAVTATTAPAPATAPELLDFGGRRVSRNPETEALHQDWKNQQATITRNQQELLRYKAMGTQTPAPAQPAAQPAAQTPAGTAQALWQSLPPEQRAEFQTALYGDDAFGAIEKYVVGPLVNQLQQQMQTQMQSVMPQVQQIQQQLRVQDEMMDLAAKHPDMDQMAPAMQAILDESPALANLTNGMEIIYQAAKARSMQAAPTAAQIMADPQVRQQIIAESRNQVIQEYLASVQSGAAPVVLGAQPAAATPVLPANKPRTLDEAHKAAIAWLGTQA